MIKKSYWLMLCTFLFPQLLWGLGDQPDVAYDQMHLEALTDSIEVLILIRFKNLAYCKRICYGVSDA